MPQYPAGTSRYVDYTSEEGGGGGTYSSFDGGYGPPDRPPRRGKAPDVRERSREERSMDSSYELSDRRDRSLDRLDRRDRSLDRLDRHDRSLERLDRRDRSMERLDRPDRSLERLARPDRSLERLDRRDRSTERLDRHERSLERLDRRDRSMERLDRRDRSLERLDRRERDVELGIDRSLNRNIDRRKKGTVDRDDRSFESLPRNDRIVAVVNGKNREMDSSLDRRQRSMDRLDTGGRSDSRDGRRHRSASREILSHDFPGQVYQHPGPGSERADSEYTVRTATRVRAAEEEERRAASRAASEIYASTRFPRPQSEMSQYTYRSGRHGSDVVSVKTKSTANGKLVMETMTAPHPCCPNTRSCCCLMVLLNLGLLLITLGFVVVLQLYDPPFVWYVGLSMLIFGFLVLFGSLIYCVFVCREVERLRPPPGELYWTKHWSKTVHVPEIHYTNNQTRPEHYRGSEFSFKTEPSRVTNGNTTSSLTRY